MILAIDFDGTLHDITHPIAGKRMGEPIAGALQAMEDLYDQGHRIIIYTVRAATKQGKEVVEEWLDHFGIDFHDITAVKPNADMFIDDRAVRFETWEQVMALFPDDDEDDD